MKNIVKILFIAQLLMCSTAATAHDFEVGGIYYKITDSAAKTVAVTYKGSYYSQYEEYSGAISIPSKVSYNGSSYSVTSIDEWCFYYCRSLTDITIPTSVTKIGKNAFAYCKITAISIPGNVTEIGSEAFYDCSSLTSFTLPRGITQISNSLFYNCKALENIEIPAGVTSIGQYAFSNCTGLKSISIPTSVTSIGRHAFNYCNALSDVYITDIAAWCSVEFENSLATPLYYAENLIVNGEKVVGLVIPSGVKFIKPYAFNYYTALKSVLIPEEGVEIGNNAFYSCTNLKSVYNLSSKTFSTGSSNNGYVAAYASKVINAPDGVVQNNYIFSPSDGLYTLVGYMGDEAEITLPASCKGANYAIGENLFKNNTNIKDIIIPQGVTAIGDYAFYGCIGLKSISIPASVAEIGNYAFCNCSVLSAVNITSLAAWCGISFNDSYSNPLLYAKEFSLNGNPLKECVIPEGVTAISSYAFYYFKGIEKITLPSSINSIGAQAFQGCNNLKTVINHSNLTLSKGNSNYGCAACYADKVYNLYGGSIEGDFAFSLVDGNAVLIGYLGNESNIVLPANYKGAGYAIGERLFEYRSDITDIVIPEGVTSIGDYAFRNCTGLVEIDLPLSLENIDKYAFYGCNNLKTLYNFSNITLTEGSSINGYVAYYAENILHIPGGSRRGDFVFTTTNGTATLVHCLQITPHLLLPADYDGKEYKIAANLFKSNTSLTGVTLPASVTSIGSDAFRGCTNLKSVYNFSNIKLTKSSKSHGYVAYYASTLFNAPGGTIEGDYVFTTIDGTPTLSYYIGSSTILTLPANYQGGTYTIADEAFKSNTKITTITIPAAVTTIGTKAFESCTGLKTVTLQGHTTTIEEYAFNKCSKLTSVHTPSLEAWCSIEFANPYSNPLFYAQELYVNDEPLTTLVIPTTITEIKNNTFYNCTTLETADLPRGLTTIGENAFRGCSNLTTATIPNTVSAMGKYIFYDCTGLTSLTSYLPGETLPTLNVDSYTFLNVSKKKCTLTVPIGSRSTYTTSSGWKDFKTIVETEDTAIEEITPSPSQQYIFDLKGNPVTTPVKGNIYIINGRKVVL